MENDHLRYMTRCLQLAANGLGHTLSNPLVGCVVVCDDQIVSEGFHRFYGGAHAEVEALKNVTNPETLKNCTVYVNLEPCSHHGKTPPCADLLISKGIGKVVISSEDPNPLVGGNGIRKLQEAGIGVITGVLDKENRELNRRFFTMYEKKRPYITLKWAQSRDGWMAPENHRGQFKLTGHLSDILVHRWRSQEMGILVGRKTIEQDDPLLNVRHVDGNHPVRIVLDPGNKIQQGKIMDNGDAPAVFYIRGENQPFDHVEYVSINSENFLEGVLHDLYQRHIVSVMVEGGSFTLGSFIKAGLWDEARIFECDLLLKKGISAPYITGTPVHHSYIDRDELTIIRNN